ncbi:MAG: hypothetical protein JNL88_12560, partial [Bacteroidia bacterium]|nr:hypothetical protein [Bacteroidia bacterium]
MTNYQKSAVKFLTGILLLSTAGAFAQLSKGPRAELASITRPNHHSGWIYFKDDLQLRPDDVFSRYKAAWALGADDELRLQRSMEMYGTGMEQQRYQQYYKGVKVHGAVFNLYLREGRAVKANGRLVHDLVSDVTPDLSEEQALASALRALDAQDYGWNDIRYV